MGTFVEGMKKNYFISAILTIALGAVLVIWPDWSGRILCYLLGAALILMGGIQLIVSSGQRESAFIPNSVC